MTDVQRSMPQAAFRELDAFALTAGALREQIGTHGYALVRGLLSGADLEPLLCGITDALHAGGWLKDAPGQRLAVAAAACSDDDPEYKDVYDKVFNLELFNAFPHHPALARVMRMLVGPELLLHPKPVARFIFPHCDRGVIHAHQDHTAVGGTSESYTAWIPLHDCPVAQGSLRVLEGSHRYGLQPTAGQTGYLVPGTARGQRWVGGEIRAGDVLLFHSLTVHEAAPNVSGRLRLSVDCRFQSYLHPVNPGALVFSGSGRRSWPRVYRDWAPDGLQFYWTRLPLLLEPSLQKLTDLSQTAASAMLRERYGRILQRIEEQDYAGPAAG